MDRARRAWRRELDQKCAVDNEVGIEAPAQAAVEALGAGDVRNGDDDDLELEVDRPCGGCDDSFHHTVELTHKGLLSGWRAYGTTSVTSSRRSPDRMRRAACLSRRDTWQAQPRCRCR